MPVQLTPAMRNAMLDGFFGKENLVACFYRGTFDGEFEKLLGEFPALTAPVAVSRCKATGHFLGFEFLDTVTIPQTPLGVCVAIFEGDSLIYLSTVYAKTAPPLDIHEGANALQFP